MVAIEVKGNGTTHQLAGTIFNKDVVKLVELDNFSMDAVPAKHMLIIPHRDVPGMIGHVGTVLGHYQINVAAMQVGRKEIGGNAVMVLAIDHAVPEEALDKMRNIDGIFDVRYVCL